MHKILISLAIFLYSAIATAGGKLVYKPEWRPTANETAQMIGLEMGTPVSKDIGIESFYGAGRVKGKEGDTDAGDWFKADQALMAYWGPLAWGVGYTGTREVTKDWTHTGYAKVSLKLW